MPQPVMVEVGAPGFHKTQDKGLFSLAGKVGAEALSRKCCTVEIMVRDRCDESREE